MRAALPPEGGGVALIGHVGLRRHAQASFLPWLGSH